MSTKPYDLVVRGGTVATASAVFPADVAIDGESDRGSRPRPAARLREIDARGKLVLPGGVDSHAISSRFRPPASLNADTFESGTVSAAFGGTTTVISFAAQHIGHRLDEVLDAYHALAAKGAVIDYAFHMIIADPTEKTLKDHLPKLVKAGHATIKVFMTYDRIKLDDMQLLDVLSAARENGALVCVHAENHAMITWTGKRLLAHGYRAPRYHGVSHPRAGEAEAFNRIIALAAFIDQPIMIFHVSSAEGAARISQARGEGLKVFAETCPQYLFLTAKDLDRPGLEGAKWICSPPMRQAVRSGGALERTVARRPADGIVGSCALSVRCDAENSSTEQTPTSRPSPTACRACRRGCRCCSTPWSHKAGWAGKIRRAHGD